MLSPTLVLLSGLALVAAIAGSGQGQGGDHSGDAEPLAVLQTQVAAWNRGDLREFCEVYAEDATFLGPSGIVQGRAAVQARYEKRYPSRAAMGTLSLEPIETRRAPNGTSVSVAARWRLVYPDKPEAKGLTLLVLHQGAGRWRIVQDASF